MLSVESTKMLMGSITSSLRTRKFVWKTHLLKTICIEDKEGNIMPSYMVLALNSGEIVVGWANSFEEAQETHKNEMIAHHYCEVYKRTSKGYKMILD